MTRREVAFLLIGLAFGLMFGVAGIVEVLSTLYRNGSIGNFSWSHGVVAIPVALLASGIVLLAWRSKGQESI